MINLNNEFENIQQQFLHAFRELWLVVLSTDLSLSDAEIVRIYGNRWSMVVFFKAPKSFMKL